MEELILEIKKIIKHENLNIYLNLPYELLIQEFKDKIDWMEICHYHKLSENFIREFKDNVNWICISKYQKISEDFIREFHDEVDWWAIMFSQKLSEDFIQEFKDRVYWDVISSEQQLSEEFILKNWHKLYHKSVFKYQETLTPAFLCWLYKTYQEEEYNELKHKNSDFREYAKKIEEEVKIVMIEFE